MPTALVAATGGARLRGRERQHAAVELRKAGASLDEIAKTLGYSNRASVHNAITAVMIAASFTSSSTERCSIDARTSNWLITRVQLPKVQVFLAALEDLLQPEPPWRKIWPGQG